MEKPDAVPFGFIYISSIDARLDLSEEVISFKSSFGSSFLHGSG